MEKLTVTIITGQASINVKIKWGLMDQPLHNDTGLNPKKFILKKQNLANSKIFNPRNFRQYDDVNTCVAVHAHLSFLGNGRWSECVPNTLTSSCVYLTFVCCHGPKLEHYCLNYERSAVKVYSAPREKRRVKYKMYKCGWPSTIKAANNILPVTGL